MLIVGHAYDRCTACSPPVLKAYMADPFGFVQQVCATPSFLEDLTGLSEMKNEEVDWGFDDVEGLEDFSMSMSGDAEM